ncbi:hypothetical protein [Planobispora takensis]|uniref:Uncharacterized protein n=1 Tax=Planobispora takensis TaxID=1367882 RepID=A0A8J3SUC2_9ACTN|nr:hypothetical protein [Planobispora takensis]GIH98982.1 hypothetical protein Pta02_09910 [Planobispora takensis]
MRVRRMAAVLLLLAPTLLLAPPASAAPKVYKGEGDRVLRIRATAEPGIVKITYDGEGYFSVWGLTSKGKMNDLLASATEAYRGTVAYNTTGAGDTAGLKISGDGAWTVQFLPLSKARYWPITAKGPGDDVLRLTRTSRGLRTLRIRYAGDGYFSAWALTASGRLHDLLASDVDRYSGTVPLPPGTRYVSVKASGPWSIVRK